MPDVQIERSALERIAAGAFGGVISALPMTIAMLSFKRILPGWQRYALPPREITLQAAEKAGIKEVESEPMASLATSAAHLGFSSAAGAVYGVLLSRLRLPTFIKGGLYGLVVWSTSYLGWIPALGLMPSARHQPIERSILMIAAHLVWGPTLAGVTRRILSRDRSNN